MARIDKPNGFVLSIQALALLVSVCFASSLPPLSGKRLRLPRSSSECTLTLYDGDIGSSPSLELTTSDSSLTDDDWDNRTSSAVVSGGCQWVLYDLTDFEVYDNIPSVISPGNYPFNSSNNETTFGLPDNVLSAVRCLPAEDTPAVALFQHHRYFGEMQVIFFSIWNLLLFNLDEAVSSLVITGGIWEFYSEANYTGSNVTLGQGLYPNADDLTPIEDDDLTSVKLIVIDCETLNNPANGQVSHPNGTTFTQTATYSCDTGYNLMGDNTRTCQADGMWSGNQPTCMIVDCGTLNASANGQVSHTAGTTFGETATYSCDPGYNLTGDSTRTCQATGMWSGREPTCQASGCNADTTGFLSWPATPAGSTRTLRCHNTTATISRTCSPSGVWETVDLSLCATLISINTREQSTGHLATVAAIVRRNAARINEMTVVPNTIVRILIYILEGLQQWNANVLQANASNIVRSFDTIGSVFAQRLDNRQNFSFMTKSISFLAEAQPLAELAETGRSFSSGGGAGNVTITTLSVNSSAATYLPASLFQSITKYTSVGMVYVVYDTGVLFPIANATEQVQGTNASITTVVGSPVLSATVGSGQNFINLTEPVRVLLQLHELENVTNLPRCVSWDFDIAGWTTDGCETDLSGMNESVVTCYCNHLTNFAILVDICSRFREDCMPSPALQTALHVLTIVGVVLSLIGIVLTVFTLLVFKKFWKQVPTIFHIQLCIALFCLLIIFVCGINKTAVYGGCVAVSALIHYFTLVSVMFMGAEAVLMFKKLVIVFSSTSTKFFVSVSLICWLVPIIPVVIPMAVDLSDAVSGDLVVRVPTPQSQGFCFISDPTVFFAAFLGPIFAILIFNVIIFVMVIGVLVKHTLHKLDRTNEQMNMKTAIRLIISIAGIMFLFGLTWLFGALTVTGLRDTTASTVFQILFVICNAFQGFFIFFFLCVFDKEARDFWLELLSCGHYQSKPLHSSQVKYTRSGGNATLEKFKTRSSGLTNSNLVSAISSKSGYTSSINDNSKEERYTDIPLTTAAAHEKEKLNLLENDPEVHETNVGTAQKQDLDSSEVKQKEQVLETSKNSEEHASSNTREVNKEDLQTST